MKQPKLLKVALATGCLLAGTGSALKAQSAGGVPSVPGSTAPQQQQMPNSMQNGGNSDMGNMSTVVDDKHFLKDAAMGGLLEVELGKVAADKAQNPEVKQFAQKMVDDHGKANDQLKQVADQDHVDVPSALDAKHQAMVTKLSKLSGPAFDKAYVKDMLKDHQEDVSKFQNEAQNGKDPNIKQFASVTLPTLQEHLKMIKSINKGEKQTASN